MDQWIRYGVLGLVVLIAEYLLLRRWACIDSSARPIGYENLKST
jgi:hypothetical protein